MTSRNPFESAFSKPDRRNRRGAMLIVILVLMIGFMATVAFSIDVSLMHLARTELRTATDAAAKAAAIELSQSLDRDDAISRGIEIAGENSVLSEPLILTNGDFAFGRSEKNNVGRFEFDPNRPPFNTVRVNGRRTAGSPSGPIPLMFGNVFGIRQFEPQTFSSATFIERDVVLVIDRSGSMFGQKFVELVEAIRVFVSTVDVTPVDERIGIASYNQQGTEDVQLTNDLEEIVRGISGLQLGGLTSISGGMSAGRRILDRGRDSNFVERTMIVMTDGQHNSGTEPRNIARQLAGQRVQIHTITFGAGADQRRMREVAAIGQGQHFHAITGEDLRRAYEEIALTLTTVITE